MNLWPSRLAVYALDPDLPVAVGPGLPGLLCKTFETGDVTSFFGADPARARTFLEFLDRGYQGVLVHDQRIWIGYGWVTSAHSPGPPHLPAWIGARHPFWLFYAHTRQAYRGRGIHKAMLRHRLAALSGPGGRPGPVYSDVQYGNVPSRRALLALGFQARGGMVRLGLPFLGGRSLCWWNRELIHPPLLGSSHEEWR